MKKKIKRISCFLAALIMSALVLVLPCFAWANIPVSSVPDTYAFAYRSNTVNTYTVYAWSYDGVTYAVMLDDRYFNIFDDNWTSNNTYVSVGSSAPTESYAIEVVNNYLNSVRNGVNGSSALNEARKLALESLEALNYIVIYYSTVSSGTNIVNEVFDSNNIDYDYNEFITLINNAQINQVEKYHEDFITLISEISTLTFNRYQHQLELPTYENGYTVGYEQGYLEGEQSSTAYQSGFVAGESQGYDNGYSVGYDDAYSVGYDNGYSLGYDNGYSVGYDIAGEMYDRGYANGYTDGGTDSGLMKNTLITIFSSPYYILNEVFNFDIFGVSVAGVIMFVISIVLVGFVIKLII